MIYRKSLYLTFRAVTYRPVPKDKHNVRKMNTGRKKICMGGLNWKKTIISIKIPNEMAKSTMLVITAAAGMIIRGKYTFEIRLVLPVRLLLASDKAEEKNCQ